MPYSLLLHNHHSLHYHSCMHERTHAHTHAHTPHNLNIYHAANDMYNYMYVSN